MCNVRLYIRLVTFGFDFSVVSVNVKLFDFLKGIVSKREQQRACIPITIRAVSD